MQYALLIYTTEATDAPDPEAAAAEMEAYNEFGRYVAERGAMRGGEALQSSASATTVRVRDGRTLATDGPFAETKEVLGGFYVVEAADLDDAIGIAARIPGAGYGSIEIRPIWDFGAESTMRGEAVAAGAD